MTRGSWAWLKTYIIYPWFAAFCMSPRPFHATAACTSCSLCARSCPLSNITMSPFPPSISSRSSQIKKVVLWPSFSSASQAAPQPRLGLPLRPLSALLPYLPSRAVAYGSATASKSRKPVYR